MEFVVVIALSIVYVAIGIALAFPYCFLAGWDMGGFVTVALVAPAFTFVWLIIALLAGIFKPDHFRGVCFNWRAAFNKDDRRFFAVFFWAWTVYGFLPVISRWTAVFLEKIGQERAGYLLNTHRYAIPLYVFVLILMSVIIIEIIKGSSEIIKKMWA